MAKKTQKELEYLKRWREKRNSDPELVKKARDYHREYMLKWRNIPKNRAKSRKASLATYYKNREVQCERSHWRNVKRKYGITKEQYEQLLSLQNGRCAICGKEKQTSGKRLGIDHCHNSALVRGILCESCNALLGSIEAREDWMSKAQNYLTNPPAFSLFKAQCAETQATGFTGESRWNVNK